MTIDSIDSTNGTDQHSCEGTFSEEKDAANPLVELAQDAGSTLPSKELEYHLSELVKTLLAEVSKTKNQYAALQKGYHDTSVQREAASRPEQSQFRANQIDQLNHTLKTLKEQMEHQISHCLKSIGICEPSSLINQIVEKINDPEIREAFNTQPVTDTETHFLSLNSNVPPFQSFLAETSGRVANMMSLVTTAPATIQDLESQLKKLATTSPDRNVKALASVMLTEVQTLAAKNLSLTTIEAWEYAATIAKMTAEAEYWIGFSNLTASEKPMFKTTSGITEFESKLSSHAFTIAETTEIAKAFSDGTIPLKNENDTKFMQAFYSDLQKGQQPKAAEENAYNTVPRASVSQATQAFVTGIVNPNPPPFTPHTPTSVQGLESQLKKLATTSPDRNDKALAAVVLSEAQTLASKNLSLTTIEAWEYAAIIGKMTANSEYWIGFSNLTADEKPFFTTISGIDQFESRLSSHDFTTAETTEIAKAFSDGTIALGNPNDGKLMQAFYANLEKGQAPKTAEENAYTTVPNSSVSKAMQTFLTGIVNPKTPPSLKSFPFTYVNNSGKSDDDVFIQIIGTNPNTKLQCFIQYDKTGSPSYVDAAKGLIPGDYSYPVSYFAKATNGNGQILNIPVLNGGRVYTSIDGKVPIQVKWSRGASEYLIMPNLGSALIMEKTEFTIQAGSAGAVFFNPTAVDDFSLPISVKETAKDGSTQTGGIGNASREKIFSEMSQELAAAGDPWPTLMPKVPPIIYSPVYAANIKIFPEDYFQNIGFVDAFRQQFSTTPLLVDAGESFPNTGVFKGTYNSATDEMTFTGSFKGTETSVVMKFPSTTSGILLGNGPLWGINRTDPQEIKALKSAIARNVSVAIDTNTLTTTEALNQKYFIKNHDNFYKPNAAMPDKLQFIDHYSKVLHGITRNIYTFGYDDEAGQSGATSFTPKDFASGVITLAPLS